MLVFLLVLSLIYFLTKCQIVKTIINICIWFWLIELAFLVGLLIGFVLNFVK